MTPKQIAGLEGELARYLKRFDDCFARSKPRGHLAVSVRGQLSNLHRKSVEPQLTFPDQINRQPWVKYHIKETEKRPIVWEHPSQRF